MSEIDDALENLEAIKNNEDPTEKDPSEHGVCPLCRREVDDDHFDTFDRDPQPQPDENVRMGLHTGGRQIEVVSAECDRMTFLTRTEEGGVEIGTSAHRVRNGFDCIGDDETGQGPNHTGQALDSDKIDDATRERIKSQMTEAAIEEDF